MAPTLDLNSAYIFNRDHRASVRLNYNHWLIQQQSGYLLHPNIPADRADLHVADIGTGTGIWLIDLSHQLPASTTLDGFDISPEQFPPPAWLPRNVRLHSHDAFKPFAEEHRGKYDVVHVRFLITVLNENNAHTLFDNLTCLLKPGGYLQWLDLDASSVRALALNSEGPRKETEKVAALMRRSGAVAMHDLKLNGLETVQKDCIKVSDCYRTPWGQSHVMGYEELWAKRSEARDHSSEALREGIEAVERLSTELKAGAGLACEYSCLLARKL